MSSRSNPAKQKGRCQCACPRNRLDGLILTQVDAISIHRIIQFIAWELPITEEDRQTAKAIFEKRCRQCGRAFGVDYQQPAPDSHGKNRKGDE